jgi:hypothetical protein
MMSRVSIAWRVFIGLEATALVASQAYSYFTSWFGPFLFTTQLLLLLPGSQLVGWRIERALWGSGVSLRSIGLLEDLASVAANALIWWAVTSLFARVRRRAAL